MNKREIIIMLINQDKLEYEFEFKISNEHWYSVKYSKESGFEGDYPEDNDFDYILLDLENDEIRNIVIK